MFSDSNENKELSAAFNANTVRNAVTMKDVAKKAGVSQGTVSNVLNGTKGVSVDKIKKVEAAVKELGYEQNALARNLKATKSGNEIYLILPNVRERAYEELYESVLRRAEELNFNITCFGCNEMQYREKAILNQAMNYNIDGILLVSCQPENDAPLKKLMNSNKNIVCIYRDANKGNYNFVGIDIRKALIQNIKTQVASGASKIAMFTGPNEYSFDAACIDAYFNALFLAKIEIKNHYLVTTNYDKESAMQQAIKLLYSDDKPDVIYATSEVLADGIRKALELIALPGSKKPKLIQFTSRDWSRVVNADEEAIILPYGEMGEKALDLLSAAIQGSGIRKGEKLVIPPQEQEKPALQITSLHRSDKTVRVMLNNNFADSEVKYLCHDFTRKTGIDVQVDLVNYRDMLKGIKDRNAEPKYDVFCVDVPWIKELVMEGYIQELDGYISSPDELRKKFPGDIFDEYSMFDGRICVLPFSFTTQLLFYRKDLFDMLKNKRQYFEWYKKELALPRTWEEYNMVARFFTRKYNPDSDTLYGTSLAGKFPTGATSEYLPRAWSRGVRLFNGESLLSDKENCLAALVSYIECFDYAHPDSSNRWWSDAAADFCSGNAAMMVQYSDQVSILSDRNISKVIGKTGFDVIPGGVSLFGGWSIGMNKNSTLKDEAFEFIKWTMAEDMMITNAVMGRIVPYTNVQNSTELLGMYPWHRDTFKVFPNARKRLTPNDANGNCISENVLENIIGGALHDAITKKCSAEDTIARISHEIETIYRSK